jgi:N-acetyl-gamma-glutamyl-phosphate/LysW-gamma-L-alpha-aminoadipyl-6-phosphate reductase
MRATVVGGSGYIGGELVRLLLGHPEVELAYVTSDRYAGRPLRTAHPNFRGVNQTFTPAGEVGETDVVFLAAPHGASMKEIDHWATRAPRIIDLSADFRLHDDRLRERYYPGGVPDPEWLSRFRTGIPELNRENLRDARHIAVAGCMANASILALHPLAAAGLVAGTVLVDARTGSSGGGRVPDEGSHHPERSGALRMAKPHGHRHIAEIEQACGVDVHMSVTAVEAVRGVQVVCHVTLPSALSERDVWAVYRDAYRNEPFVRLVRERSALHRLPEPKLLSGTNFCDIGLTVTPGTEHLIVVSAIDNLVKGGAGNAVQCLNIAAGYPETTGLEFMGLHPL